MVELMIHQSLINILGSYPALACACARWYYTMIYFNKCVLECSRVCTLITDSTGHFTDTSQIVICNFSKINCTEHTYHNDTKHYYSLKIALSVTHLLCSADCLHYFKPVYINFFNCFCMCFSFFNCFYLCALVIIFIIVVIRGLYNLTCVDATYPLIEKVIRALVQLSSTSTGKKYPRPRLIIIYGLFYL